MGVSLKEILLDKVPFTKPMKNGEALITKCVFCEEGKHYDSTHMQVNLAKNNNEFNWVYCYLCHTHAIVTPQFLMDNWNIYDNDIIMGVSNHNNKLYNNLPKIKKYNEINNINYTYIRDCKESYDKLNYINNRIGSNLTFKDLIDLKILVNIRDLFEENNITEYTRHELVIRDLDKYFMGFISYDNSFLNMRNTVYNKIKLHDNINKRFVNYNIYDKMDNTKSYYIIPTCIPINPTERIKIHIAEGGFDILSVYLNLRNKEGNSIYSSIPGAKFKYLIQQYIKSHHFIFSEFHIYVDNDSRTNFNYLKDMMSPFGIPMYLHYNDYPNENDFGVPISRIKERVILL